MPPRILIIEDDDALRGLYTASLGLAGFEVEEAPNGLEALRRIDDNRPDAVVLDLGLPFISGVTVCQDLSARSSTRHIPIVVVTGSEEDLDWLEVACVLRKPVAPERLIAALWDCLGKKP
jgi:DNA-binding response OmpR family regulator